jgi:hypothetical protein
MATHTVNINRAPVLTLWATVVAERLGYDHDAALTLGRAVAGLNAHSKARRLGIIEEPNDEGEKSGQRARKPGKPSVVTLLGRPVPTMNTGHGLRATRQDQPIAPRGVTRYVQQKFGAALPDVRPRWKRWLERTHLSNWRLKPTRYTSSFAQPSPRGHEAGEPQGHWTSTRFGRSPNNAGGPCVAPRCA